MKQLQLSETMQASNLVMGCMRINALCPTEVDKLVHTALELGINFFDHADIYGGDHACEQHFAQSLSMTPALREKMYIQTKCGICKGYFDFSREHILESVDASLKALQTDYLDVLLLHRPDALMEPEEVAEAFSKLKNSGKVRYFGVSNQNPMQLELLQHALPDRLIVNQMQLSIAHTPMIDHGLTVNMACDNAIDRTGSVLEYCRLKSITVQAWSPFQMGFFDGPFLGDTKKYAALNEVIDRIAMKYDVTNTAVAVGWLTRHPANMQVIVGTTRAGRMIDAAKGSALALTRSEWYEIYRAAGNILP